MAQFIFNYNTDFEEFYELPEDLIPTQYQVLKYVLSRTYKRRMKIDVAIIVR